MSREKSKSSSSSKQVETQIAGLSKMKAADLNQALADHFTEEELAQEFTVRGYQLTEKGKQALKDHQAIIDRHPKKNL